MLFQSKDNTLTALAGLVTGANKLPYFTGNDVAALTELTSVGRLILAKTTVAEVLTYLGLDRLSQGPTATSLLSQNGTYQLTILNNGTWGLFRVSDGAYIPISISAGGTGATTVTAARTNLGFVNDALPLSLGGTGAKTQADARTNLGVERLSQGPTATSLLSQNGTYQLTILNNGTWGLFRVSDGAYIPISISAGGTGAATAVDARINLGLGDGSILPVGVPIPWPTATPPSGWLKCNGASFTAAQYPKLAAAYPGLVLPDLRGEFIRGWDDGRGLDSGRALLSAQADAIRNIAGTFVGYDYGGDSAGFWTGAFTRGAISGNMTPTTGTAAYEVQTTFSAASVVPVASENRPVNIAFNYIVRAE